MTKKIGNHQRPRNLKVKLLWLKKGSQVIVLYFNINIVVTTGIIVVSSESDPACDSEDIPGTIKEMIDTIHWQI